MSVPPRINREGILKVSEGVVQEVAMAGHCAGCVSRCSGAAIPVRLTLGDHAIANQLSDSLGWGLPDGQRVHVSVSASGLTRAAMVIFGVPVAALLLGALAGDLLAAHAGSVVMGYSLLFLVMGLLLRFASSLADGTRLRIEPASDPL